MKKTALYAGSFDPFTNGHCDIVTRALRIFDEVTILVAVSPNKKNLFTKDERLNMLENLFKDNSKVKIASWEGLLVDYAKENNISALIRGLRPTGDFEIEFQMASMNQKLYDELETVFLMTGENLYYISSSLVKEVFQHGGCIKKFVPKIIFDEIGKINK
ncbi:MAG: pantetheine-phosphate adenylyltransferase [Halobacteriovoraceae bacterium]|jgi:pantetheine-phosphate adenylyltransferase|nr:pantetheine-phosphate adenylyltransferase [Halobacteriovoraceae bacterium]